MAQVSVSAAPPASHRLRRARSRVPVWHVLWLVVAAIFFLLPDLFGGAVQP